MTTSRPSLFRRVVLAAVVEQQLPAFDRNRTPVVARNVVHHSAQYPSSLTVTVVPARAALSARQYTWQRLTRGVVC